jgi:hypothetical protein
MTSSRRRAALMLGLAFLCAFNVTHVVQAQEPVPIATKMTVEPLQPVEVGKPVIIAAQLSLVGSEFRGAQQRRLSS